MITCNMCKNWEPGEGYFCPKDKGYCNAPTGGPDQIIKPDRGAAGHGEPGDPGRVKTGPLFGCINAIEKSVAPQTNDAVHPSHDMTEWESTIVTLQYTSRYGQIRECKNCGAEHATTAAGENIHYELLKLCPRKKGE